MPRKLPSKSSCGLLRLAACGRVSRRIQTLLPLAPFQAAPDNSLKRSIWSSPPQGHPRDVCPEAALPTFGVHEPRKPRGCRHESQALRVKGSTPARCTPFLQSFNLWGWGHCSDRVCQLMQEVMPPLAIQLDVRLSASLAKSCDCRGTASRRRSAIDTMLGPRTQST